jgi:hypothetical protein
MKKENLKKMVREELSLLKEFRVRIVHERVNWLALLLKSFEETGSDGNYTTFELKTNDGGILFWDVISDDDVRGDFDHFEETKETLEAEGLVRNLQTEFRSAKEIQKSTVSLIGKVKAEEEIAENDDF